MANDFSQCGLGWETGVGIRYESVYAVSLGKHILEEYLEVYRDFLFGVSKQKCSEDHTLFAKELYVQVLDYKTNAVEIEV